VIEEDVVTGLVGSTSRIDRSDDCHRICIAYAIDCVIVYLSISVEVIYGSVCVCVNVVGVGSIEKQLVNKVLHVYRL